MSDKPDKAEAPREPPFSVTLAHPIPLKKRSGAGTEDAPITSVTILRRPRFRDLKAVANRDKLTQSEILIERLTDLPKPAIDELDVVDFEMLSETIAPFFSAEVAASDDS